MRGNQGYKEAATGEEDVRDERKSRSNRKARGLEQASCPGERPQPPSPQRGMPGCIECSRCPFHRTLFTLHGGPAPVSVAFRCHFTEKKECSCFNSFDREAFISLRRSLAGMLRSARWCGGMHRLHQSPQGRSSSCERV